MLYDSCDSAAQESNKAGCESLDENAMQEMLKRYYLMCCKMGDKRALIKDPTLLQVLCSLMVDPRLALAVYSTKILLALTENAEDARLLVTERDGADLRAQLDKALSGSAAEVPPRVLRKLFIVQTRLANAANSNNKGNIGNNKLGTERPPPMRKTIFGASAIGSKQFVFSFDRPNDAQRRAIEQKCVQTKGVVSVCFQQLTAASETRCLIRCRDGVEAKTIAAILLRAGGFELVKQQVRMADGTSEIFEFYADQLEQEEAECGAVKELPKYLDDLEVFDDGQCLATKEQIETQQRHGAGWLSSLKSIFW